MQQRLAIAEVVNNVAIQLRRGSYDDLNPNALLEGEACVTTQDDPSAPDGKGFYIKNGTLKQVITDDILDIELGGKQDTLSAGNGVEIANGTIKVKLSDNNNILGFISGGLVASRNNLAQDNVIRATLASTDYRNALASRSYTDTELAKKEDKTYTLVNSGTIQEDMASLSVLSSSMYGNYSEFIIILDATISSISTSLTLNVNNQPYAHFVPNSTTAKIVFTIKHIADAVWLASGRDSQSICNITGKSTSVSANGQQFLTGSNFKVYAR